MNEDYDLKQLLIVTGDRFPNGDAGAVRTSCLAALFRKLGYEVRVIGYGPSTKNQWCTDGDILYFSLRSVRQTLFTRVRDRMAASFRVKNLMKNIPQPDAILVVSASEMTTRFLKNYASRRHIRLLHDAVEWYSPEEFRLGRFARAYRVKDRFNRKLIDQQFSVIAISTFLEEHFASRGLTVSRIPAVLDVHGISAQKNICEDKRVFVYAGAPGRKDHLREILEGVALVDGVETHSFEIRLIGVTEQQLKEESGVSGSTLCKLEGKLRFYGRVPRSEVLKNLSEADFALLLRPAEQRYARAGFPTKIVESLATSTPPITNLSSDLHLYLRNGENCILASECSAEAFSEAFCAALNADYPMRCRLQTAARECAEQYFDYRRYTSEIKQLL